jgi:hypothetical protein
MLDERSTHHLASPNGSTPELRLPARWTLAPNGLCCDGVFALAFDGGVDEDGRVVINGRVIPPIPVDWTDTWIEWVIHFGEQYGAVLDPATEEMLREFLDDIDVIRPTHPTLIDAMYPDLTPELQQLFILLDEYLYLTDRDYILAVLATAVVQALQDDDPLWLMVVSPSSSGKTEAVKLLKHVQNGRLSDITVAGLLAGSGSGGLLSKFQNKNALITVSDFSTLLGDPRMSGSNKAEVFNALRDIYDGYFRRDINPQPIFWQGRLTIVAACTPAIDTFSAYSDALGTRFVYYRQREHTKQDKNAMSTMSFARKGLGQKRDNAAMMAKSLIEVARARVETTEVPSMFEQGIVDASVLVGYGRASVPRDNWGKREISDVAYAEEPGRLTGQLRSLSVGLLALGLDQHVALRIVRHTAISSMPQSRAKVLAVLAHTDGPVSTNSVAQQSGLERKVAQRALEDWQAVGVVYSSRDPESVSTEPHEWHVAHEFTTLVRDVFSSSTQEGALGSL